MDLDAVVRRLTRVRQGHTWSLFAIVGEGLAVVHSDGLGNPYRQLLGWRAPDEVDGLVLVSSAVAFFPGRPDARGILAIGATPKEVITYIAPGQEQPVKVEMSGLTQACLQRNLGLPVKAEVDGGDLLARVLLDRVYGRGEYTSNGDPLLSLALILGVVLEHQSGFDWAHPKSVEAIHARLSENPEALWQAVDVSASPVGTWMGPGMGLTALNQQLSSKEVLLSSIKDDNPVLAARLLLLLKARGWWAGVAEKTEVLNSIVLPEKESISATQTLSLQALAAGEVVEGIIAGLLPRSKD